MPAVHEAPFDAGWTTTVPVGDPALARILEALAPLHPRLCPRQVLGARIGLQGGRLLRLALPQVSGQKRLLSFVETDGCFLDGVAAATGCSVGHRTMRIVDQGKVAVTFVDNATGHAVRVWPRGDARQQALAYAACDRSNRWLAQRDGYLRLPVEQLLQWRDVKLAISLETLAGRPGLRVTCAGCDEEIINGREVRVGAAAYCRSCVGESYLDRARPAAHIDCPSAASQAIAQPAVTSMIPTSSAFEMRTAR